MELDTANIPAANQLAAKYIDHYVSVEEFFDFDWKDKESYRNRYEQLMEQQFSREELAACISEYVHQFPCSDETERSIEKLRMNNSVAVVGGQQAGLLTGPLYTIHKIVSIIKFAEKQERELGVPVVPVFWVAGEDHDYLEINHVYTPDTDTMKKNSFGAPPSEKKMASDLTFDKIKMKQWVEEIFFQFGEYAYTKDLLKTAESAIENADSFTDMFSHIVMKLFNESGLLLIDSADPMLRRLEQPLFSRMISHHRDIAQAVIRQQSGLAARGFTKAIEMEDNAANLFYRDQHGERQLLFFHEATHTFRSKTEEIIFTPESLFDELSIHPECFSNNVVTRPLMQEYLFPTLAFIAGPGEIAYWAELREAFAVLGFRMPPLIPRLNITLMDQKTERDLKQLNLVPEKVLREGAGRERDQFLSSLRDVRLETSIASVKEMLHQQYSVIEDIVQDIDRGHRRLSEKNLEIHMGQLDFLLGKIDESVRKKHRATLEKYRNADLLLRPLGLPQERVWNVFYFLNQFGQHLIDELISLPFDLDGSHYIVKV